MEKNDVEKLSVKKSIANSVFSNQYMNLKALSDYSGMPISTLRHYMKHQEMPSFKLAGKIYISRSEFDDWMERHRLNSSINLNLLVEEALRGL